MSSEIRVQSSEFSQPLGAAASKLIDTLAPCPWPEFPLHIEPRGADVLLRDAGGRGIVTVHGAEFALCGAQRFAGQLAELANDAEAGLEPLRLRIALEQMRGAMGRAWHQLARLMADGKTPGPARTAWRILDHALADWKEYG